MPERYERKNFANPTRPMLRWHGGKWRLAKWIQSWFPPHQVYVEPFCGAANVLLRKPRSYAEYLNDLDGDLINFFRVLQEESRAARLIHLLAVTPFARAEFQRAYEHSDDPVERARRLCIRSFMGFSSASANSERQTGFRSRSFRAHTGPAMDWRNYPDSLREVVERLRGVTIESQPALQVIKRLDTPKTLFYVDPPYPEATRTHYGAYRFEMSDAEHQALATCLDACRGYTIVSGYRCELYERLYAEWHCEEQRAMSDHGWRTECLWLSPRTMDALRVQKQARRQFRLTA